MKIPGEMNFGRRAIAVAGTILIGSASVVRRLSGLFDAGPGFQAMQRTGAISDADLAAPAVSRSSEVDRIFG